MNISNILFIMILILAIFVGLVERKVDNLQAKVLTLQNYANHLNDRLNRIEWEKCK